VPTIAELLAASREGLERLSPQAAAEAQAAGTALIDIRDGEQRRRDGVIPGAIWHPRNVLEWRVDRTSNVRDERLGGPHEPLILLCNEGYATSLAAVSLHALGFAQATDVDGGFEAWRAAGLPVRPFDEARDAESGSRA
jgi:rhodanese-related sulfurtransferase